VGVRSMFLCPDVGGTVFYCSYDMLSGGFKSGGILFLVLMVWV